MRAERGMGPADITDADADVVAIAERTADERGAEPPRAPPETRMLRGCT